MYKLTYKKSAIKALKKIPPTFSKRLRDALADIARAPYDYQGDWKKLKGAPYWRLRQGSYRAICSIDDGELIVLVLKIGPRGDVYK